MQPIAEIRNVASLRNNVDRSAATIVFDRWDEEKIPSNLLQRFKRISME